MYFQMKLPIGSVLLIITKNHHQFSQCHDGKDRARTKSDRGQHIVLSAPKC